MAMFPDSGVPPADAKNSLPDVITAGCHELWYSTARCQPRFDPAAANAMLAEDMNLIMRGEVLYECARLDHIERAVRYITQRGLPRACALSIGPFDYLGVLDPGITRHNDFMTLTIIPNVDNQGAASLNLGVGAAPILRNDGLPLKSKDMKAGKPAIIAFYAGAWYMCGLVASQVPLIATGAVDAWVRTDGSDILGDGTSNTPEKAFKTIQGAWNTVGTRYAASPLFSINIRLGIPGDYTAANIGPFGGNMSVTGDPNNRAVYRILSGPTQGSSLTFSSIGSAFVTGCHLVMNTAVSPPGVWPCCIGVGGGNLWLDRNQYSIEANNPGTCGVLIIIGTADVRGIDDHIIEGNGLGVSWGMFLQQARYSGSPGARPPSVWTWRNLNFRSAGHSLQDASVIQFGNTVLSPVNCTGSKYGVNSNSVLYQNGQPMPGNLPGTVGTQGQAFA